MKGAWQETEPIAAEAGSRAPLAPPVKEPFGNQRTWAVLGVAIALPFALWTLTAIGAHPLEAGVQLAVLLGVGGVALRSVVKTHTRRVQFDDAGISDADFFGLRRVPWSAVKGFKVVNLNLKAQQRHDRSRNKKRSERPEDRMAWNVCDEQGVVLLQLPKNMVPQDALAALRERIQLQVRGGGADSFGFAKQRPAPRGAEALEAFAGEIEALAEEGRALDPRDEAPIREHEAIVREMDQVTAKFRRQNKSAERIVQVFMALVLLPLVFGTGYLCYETLWFKLAAARTDGWVVEIAAGSTPSLVVEYRTAAGEVLRTKTDGSDDYAEFSVGDNVRVFYDPAQPWRARLDFFEEHWLGALLLGGLTLLVGLLEALVIWGTMRPFRRK